MEDVIDAIISFIRRRKMGKTSQLLNGAKFEQFVGRAADTKVFKPVYRRPGVG